MTAASAHQFLRVNHDYSPNPAINEVVNWLIEHGYPAIPVAPYHDPLTTPHFQLNAKTGGRETKFCGKNPSYLNPWGTPVLMRHQLFHHDLPTEEELKRWFAHPNTGIATLGGWNSTLWVDIDSKHYDSPEECQAVFMAYLEHVGLKEGGSFRGFVEITQSGGGRVGIRYKDHPDWCNFSFKPGERHVGEVQGTGKVAVLAPTCGPQGLYHSLSREYPPEVESLELMSLFPYSNSKQAVAKPTPRWERSTQWKPGPSWQPPDSSELPAFMDVEILVCARVKSLIQCPPIDGDRSEVFVTIAREVLGWENLLGAHGSSLAIPALQYLIGVGERMGLDENRVGRILRSSSGGRPLEDSEPALYTHAGEEGCISLAVCRYRKSMGE